MRITRTPTVRIHHPVFIKRDTFTPLQVERHNEWITIILIIYISNYPQISTDHGWFFIFHGKMLPQKYNTLHLVIIVNTNKLPVEPIIINKHLSTSVCGHDLGTWGSSRGARQFHAGSCSVLHFLSFQSFQAPSNLYHHSENPDFLFHSLHPA